MLPLEMFYPRCVCAQSVSTEAMCVDSPSYNIPFNKSLSSANSLIMYGYLYDSNDTDIYIMAGTKCVFILYFFIYHYRHNNIVETAPFNLLKKKQIYMLVYECCCQRLSGGSKKFSVVEGCMSHSIPPEFQPQHPRTSPKYPRKSPIATNLNFCFQKFQVLLGVGCNQ